MSDDQLKQLEKVLPDIRELHQILVSKDIGQLRGVDILFLGDAEPTHITYTQTNWNG